MGRYYNGDIEGKFWFGVQSSNAADRFGATGTEPQYLYYYFDTDNLPTLESELSTIKTTLGGNLAKLDAFFATNPHYNDEKLSEATSIPLPDVRHLLSDYADYKLGLSIKESIEANGQCEFTAEL